MNDELRAWKDEDYRDGLEVQPGEHPAGRIDLTSIGGSAPEEAELTTVVCFTITAGTAALSCWPACNSTISKGNCAFLTLGACP